VYKNAALVNCHVSNFGLFSCSTRQCVFGCDAHIIVLIIFPLTFQTVIIAQKLSVGGREYALV